MLKRLLLPLALLCAAPLQAQLPSLQQEVEAVLAKGPAGTRFGLLVVDETGRELVAVDPDQRFIPASNTKMFTTAAAYALMSEGQGNSPALGGTVLQIVPRRKGSPDLILRGEGGVGLSTATDCVRRCLAGLVANLAGRTRAIANIVVDDTAFVDQRWSPGMSWNNIQTDSGTAVSALIVDDNERPLVVTAGAIGQPPKVVLSPYFTLVNEAVTTANGSTRLAYERAVNGREVRLYGSIAADALPWRDLLGIDDPAHYAGWALQQALKAKGIRMGGRIEVRRRPALFSEPQPAPQAQASAVGSAKKKSGPSESAPIAAFVQPADPLDEMVTAINKPSQNLYSEALLRRLGMAQGWREQPTGAAVQPGSREAGLAAMRAVLELAGIPRSGYDFSDGSGMSTYNRLSPRASVALLRWIATQPWGEKWYASLPVAGIDGTLGRRFGGTPLEGNLSAKTGTLNATSALSGRFRAKSGRMLTFGFFANDVPDGTSALAAMEAALVLVAERS